MVVVVVVVAAAAEVVGEVVVAVAVLLLSFCSCLSVRYFPNRLRVSSNIDGFLKSCGFQNRSFWFSNEFRIGPYP